MKIKSKPIGGGKIIIKVSGLTDMVNASVVVCALQESATEINSQVHSAQVTKDNLVQHLVALIRVHSASMKLPPDELLDMISAEVNSNNTTVTMD